MGSRNNFKQALYEMFGIGKDVSSPDSNEDNVPKNTFEKADKEYGDRLKPCPFCGGKAETWKVLDTNMYVVGCVDNQSCIGNIKQITRVFLTDESAVETWNRRAET